MDQGTPFFLNTVNKALSASVVACFERARINCLGFFLYVHNTKGHVQWAISPLIFFFHGALSQQLKRREEAAKES